MLCKICSEMKSGPEHDVSEKHLKNKALYEYSLERKKNAGNRKGAVVTCNVKSSYSAIVDNADGKIKISVSLNMYLILLYVSTMFQQSNGQLHKHPIRFSE
ncbi:unnamed protein product [Diatraea saccharalis]|uniref:Uncharacterized protein n=1 Tax=Diatraea saccharalis TaxID=40085 RepID=A0A9N9R3X0_9NEOP|nr:unnamed protein product [Diatraea saccharalis]